MALEQPRNFNVLVTGTPGTGKSSLSQMLASDLGLNHLEIGKIIKEHQFYTEFDEQYQSMMIEEEDEDRLLDYLEPIMVRGGNVVDYHSCELFPKRWFHLVLVLKVDTAPHFDRLTARGYDGRKREENMDAEIEAVVEVEAVESFDEHVVQIVQHNTLEEMCAAVELVRAKMEEFRLHGASAAAAASA
jgi:adenylate kinase